MVSKFSICLSLAVSYVVAVSNKDQYMPIDDNHSDSLEAFFPHTSEEAPDLIDWQSESFGEPSEHGNEDVELDQQIDQELGDMDNYEEDVFLDLTPEDRKILQDLDKFFSDNQEQGEEPNPNVDVLDDENLDDSEDFLIAKEQADDEVVDEVVDEIVDDNQFAEEDITILDEDSMPESEAIESSEFAESNVDPAEYIAEDPEAFALNSVNSNHSDQNSHEEQHTASGNFSVNFNSTLLFRGSSGPVDSQIAPNEKWSFSNSTADDDIFESNNSIEDVIDKRPANGADISKGTADSAKIAGEDSASLENEAAESNSESTGKYQPSIGTYESAANSMYFLQPCVLLAAFVASVMYL